MDIGDAALDYQASNRRTDANEREQIFQRTLWRRFEMAMALFRIVDCRGIRSQVDACVAGTHIKNLDVLARRRLNLVSILPIVKRDDYDPLQRFGELGEHSMPEILVTGTTV